MIQGEFQNKQLICKECGRDFLFSIKEQEFFKHKGFQHEPARCPDCRQKRKQKIQEEMTEITCASCGKKTKALIDINKDQPVYCRECFEKIKENPIS